MAQTPPDKDNKLFIAFICSMAVILILLLWIIFRKPEPEPSSTSKQTRDSIKMLTGQIEEQKGITDHYLHIADSLKALPPKLTIIYREQKKFTTLATIDQLDSIIRTNAGLPRRNMVKHR